MIFCGDFNFLPNPATYNFILNKQMKGNNSKTLDDSEQQFGALPFTLSASNKLSHSWILYLFQKHILNKKQK